MRAWVMAAALAVALLPEAAQAHYTKRTDACGCHHQWGLRHCHPSRRTSHCEAPASKTGPEKKSGPPKAQQKKSL
jgi:hypothetical protein